MGCSHYLSGKLLESSAKAVGFSSGDPLYLALLSEPALASEDGTTLQAKEVVYGGYGRVAVPAASLSDPNEGLMWNVATIELPPLSSGQAAVRAWALLDDQDAGNLHWFGAVVGFIIDGDDPQPAIAPKMLRLYLPG